MYLIFGASQGLGLSLAKQLKKRGNKVIGVSRRKSVQHEDSVYFSQWIPCDALDKDTMLSTLKNIGSTRDLNVISTMSAPFLGIKNLIDVLEECNIKRFVLVTSLGCGDGWEYLSERARKAFGEYVREKTLGETWLQSSSLNYIIIRPGGLRDDNVTGTGILSQGKEVHGYINRDELSRLIIESLDSKSAAGQAFECVDPEYTA
ncbi:NAD(P)H-binding protein [Dongshaea marina]|uniref:NAD(P)H-binding protein n=1 Tax=Dongshaea marina TaxID=2047966 RepID=UPI000D3E16D5|nr:NAD(P)H-binding protein [Dongshaea marina]